MKNIITDDFLIKQGIINDTNVNLVIPKASVEWTLDNLHLRSVVFNEDFSKVLSRGFPKFFNQGERVDLIPDIDPFGLSTELSEKVDGSLLIVSIINGKLNIRTRGTLDVFEAFADKADELYDLIWKYGKFFRFIVECNENDVSFLFEWTSPNQRIVIDYGKIPELRFIGMVSLKTGELATQTRLDTIAKNWDLKRPRIHFPKPNEDLRVSDRDIEGYVVYKNYQEDCGIFSMKKLKTHKYLKLHALRGSFSTKDIFKDWLQGDEHSIESLIEIKSRYLKEFDWETVEYFKNDLKQFEDTVNVIKGKINKIESLFETIDSSLNKKEFAEHIKNHELKTFLFLKYKFSKNRDRFIEEALKKLIKIEIKA